jgi:DNA-directed RNA polymerase subunit K/omega
MNKYEMVLIAAREARRLNEVAKLSGRELRVRPTTVAWDRLTQGKIQHTYEPEAAEPQRQEDGGA